MVNRAVELVSIPKKHTVEQERVFQNNDSLKLIWSKQEMAPLSSVVSLYGQNAMPGKVFFWYFTKQITDGDVEYCAQTHFPPDVLPVKFQAWDPRSLAIKLADFYIAQYSAGIINSFDLIRSSLLTT